MKDYKILKLLDLFKGIFNRIGIDYPALRKILQVKLLLDSRRVATVLQSQMQDEKKAKKERNNFLSSLGIYILFGLVMIPLLLFDFNLLFQMTMVFGIFMFFMFTTLISDFSSVLLDLRDKEILLSRPINSRTLNAAKVLHIFFYISMITFALMGPALITALFKRGIGFFLLLFAELILIDLFLIVFTGIIYYFILKLFDGEKLRDIINYVQIGLSIAISVGYQLLGRIFNLVDIFTVEFSGKWWSYFIAPLWFASTFEYVLNNNRLTYISVYSLMAIIIPIISILIYIKLIPTFEQNLQKLTSAGGQRRGKAGITNLFARLVCRDRRERNFYKFSRNMMKNERTFKLKVYPNLGFGLIFPFIMLFGVAINSSFSELRDSKMYFSIYFISLSLLTMIQFLSYSGNYKGAWLYATMPVDYSNLIYRAAVKAAFVNLFTPIFLLVSLAFLIIFGIGIMPHILIIYLNMMIIGCLVFRLTNYGLPFSRAFEMTQRKGGLVRMLLAFLILIAAAGIHFAFTKFAYGIYIYILIAIIANAVAWKYAFNIEPN